MAAHENDNDNENEVIVIDRYGVCDHTHAVSHVWMSEHGICRYGAKRGRQEHSDPRQAVLQFAAQKALEAYPGG